MIIWRDRRISPTSRRRSLASQSQALSPPPLSLSRKGVETPLLDKGKFRMKIDTIVSERARVRKGGSRILPYPILARPYKKPLLLTCCPPLLHRPTSRLGSLAFQGQGLSQKSRPRDFNRLTTSQPLSLSLFLSCRGVETTLLDKG